MNGNETADERGRASAGAGSGLTAGPVIAGFGSQSALARAIGARQSTVQHWAKTGQIPSWRRPEIARAAEERGIALGGASELPGGPGGPGGPAELKTETAPLRHGRADISTDVADLRDELARLRETIARLTEEVTRLRADRSGSTTAAASP